jgi:hypothetical protein
VKKARKPRKAPRTRPARRRPRRIRKNPSPGEVVLVWIWPDGGIARIPAGKTHATAVPEELRPEPGKVSRCKPGFFRGAQINQRLYVEKNGGREPSAAQVKKLRDYARREGLSRGIVIEQIPAG